MWAVRQVSEHGPFEVHPIGVVRSALHAVAEAPNQAFEGPATLRVAALEAIDGTPIVDLKVAMRGSPEA